MYTVGSLFSGIGGFDIGLEKTGQFKTIWFSEVDEYATRILKKHWPDVPNHGDIKTIPWRKIKKPDIIIGGFPCQDVSIAGKGAGIKEGTRSGLWKEFAKAIRILRPKYALIENVPMLANRGLNIVLSDLAKIGYDAEWNIISAASVGAPHKRERLFIIAYPNISNSNSLRCNRRSNEESKWSETNAEIQRRGISAGSSNHGSKRVQRFSQKQIQKFPEFSWCENVRRIEDLQGRPDIPKPLIRRDNNGLSTRFYKDRIKCLGNAIVPQVAQAIGEMILEYEIGVE